MLRREGVGKVKAPRVISNLFYIMPKVKIAKIINIKTFLSLFDDSTATMF